MRSKRHGWRSTSFTPVVLTALTAFFAAGCEAGPDADRDFLMGPDEAALSRADSLAPLYEMDNPDRLRGRYIVRFNPDVSDAAGAADAVIARHGGRVYEVLSGLKGFWGELPEQAIQGLRRNPNVAYIEADVAIPVTGVGETTQFSPPWPLDRVDQRLTTLDGAYEYSADGSGVRIWIIDTGVDRNAPDLAGRIDESWYVTNNGKDPYAPCNPHGTRVATTAAGTNRGVAKGATIHSARVDADDCEHLSTGAASFAFEFIGDHSPRPAVINYSAGKECGFWGCGQTVDDAAKYARSKGVTVVVSAGNDGNDACDYAPAHVPELLVVGASNQSDARIDIAGWWASNYGSCLDLFAPVENDGGTSNAAPMVTGVAALHLGLYPGASPSSVESAILSKTTNNQLSNIGSGSPNRLLYSKQPPFRVRILGGSTMGSFTSCTWSADPSGGQPSYQYEWRRDGTLVSTSSSYSASGTNSSFNLELSATDGVGRTAADVKSVTYDPNNSQLRCTA